MGNGIIVCGLNGCGKSTLGRALAARLGYHFIDNEDLYFPKTDPDYPFSSPRSDSEVGKLLIDEVTEHGNFVFAAVRGDNGREILEYYRYAVLIDVPREIRLQRIRNRSYQRFGDRMLPGGDLFEQEEKFFRFAGERPDDYAEVWARSLRCPVIRVDGTRPIEENVNFITEQIFR